ncbi:DUF4190 domain-containing protein [Streptomyces macrosporus]|uniref:DUF4190 domain-containing protein n=1 Tax=Streptomyces macrosporus TaxID=44032 RepID=A0ABN3KIV5_9ACTN
MTSEQHPFPPAPGPRPPYPAPHGNPPGNPWGGVPGGAYAHGWAPPPRPRNGIGVAALVLGIVAAVTGASFFLSPLGCVLGVVALVLGTAGLRRVRAGTATNRGQALAGVWTGAGAVLLSAALSVVLAFAVCGVLRFTEVTSEEGTVHRPAAPGEAVVYGDGLTVRGSLAVEEGAGPSEAGRVRIVFTLSNDGDETIDLRDGDIEFSADVEPIPEGDVERAASTPDELAPGDSARAEFSMPVPEGTVFLSADYAPGADHDVAFWDFGTPFPDVDTPGQPEGPDDTTSV